jgi:hypothetical protein
LVEKDVFMELNIGDKVVCVNIKEHYPDDSASKLLTLNMIYEISDICRRDSFEELRNKRYPKYFICVKGMEEQLFNHTRFKSLNQIRKLKIKTILNEL